MFTSAMFKAGNMTDPYLIEIISINNDNNNNNDDNDNNNENDDNNDNDDNNNNK